MNNNEQRPKTTGLDVRKKVTSEFHSSSTSTNFSFTSDEDYDTDLEDDTSQYRDHSCIGIYEHVCKREKSIPVGHYLRHYADSELSLCFYGLGPKGVRTFIPSLTVRREFCQKSEVDNSFR